MEHVIGLEFHGARAAVLLDEPGLATAVHDAAPLGATLEEPVREAADFKLLSNDGRYSVVNETGEQHDCGRLDIALHVLGSHLLLYLMGHSPDLLFIHAPAVAYGGRAIVLPGRVGIGKSTLMMALLRSGVDFYSDDFLPLDVDGNAHPYPAPPTWLNPQTGSYEPRDLRAMGVRVGQGPTKVGVVAHVVREPGATLQLRAMTPGEGVLMLLDNALGTHPHPALALTAARNAVNGACLLEGRRDDPYEAAAALLKRL